VQRPFTLNSILITLTAFELMGKARFNKMEVKKFLLFLIVASHSLNMKTNRTTVKQNLERPYMKISKTFNKAQVEI
jgi:hypothetical protein